MERKAIQFKMICEDNHNQFEKTINELLGRGWELNGKTYTDIGETTNYHFQAMVKYEEKPDNATNI